MEVRSTPSTNELVASAASRGERDGSSSTMSDFLWDWAAGRRMDTRMEPENDNASLWQAVMRDMVQSMVGVAAAEVWLAETTPRYHRRFRRPHAAFFVDPAHDDVDNIGVLEALLKEADGQYAHMNVGLVGMLWDRAARDVHDGFDIVPLRDLASSDEWLHDTRSRHAAAAFAFAAAVRVHDVSSGASPAMLVLYLSHSQALSHPRNVVYLAQATRLVGAVSATASPRQQLRLSKGNRAAGWRKCKRAYETGELVTALRRLAITAQDHAQRQSSACYCCHSVRTPKRLATFGAAVRASVLGYLAKWRGVPGAQPRAVRWRDRSDWATCAWAFFGSGATLLVLSSMSTYIDDQTDGRHSLLLGSSGALVAILYGAPHSSFAQPRAVIGSHMVAATVAVGTVHLGVPTHVAVAVAPATAIALNHRLGLLHPPAAAAALIFVTGTEQLQAIGWMYLLLPLLVANAVCLLMAASINNLSTARQFPLYWVGSRWHLGSWWSWERQTMRETQRHRGVLKPTRNQLPLPIVV